MESKQVDLQRLTRASVSGSGGFRDRHNQALFHDTRFTGLDLPDDQAAPARGGGSPEVYGAAGPGRPWALGSLPASLSHRSVPRSPERATSFSWCSLEAEATPEAGPAPAGSGGSIASRPTRAYHLRRAACLARAGDRQAAERERRAAEGQQVATAFDHYLAGQERYERNEPIAAIRHFDEALRQQPGHFWAQCLSAICWLQLGDPAAQGRL